jgi:hypothetical protein
MTSFRQIDANRRNARKSTGPKTAEGKLRSRCNALRHGLTAETVVTALEDAADYAEFEAAVTADYDAPSAIERELVLRLASLLWRLRRATMIETGLFEIQAKHLAAFRQTRGEPSTADVVYAMFGRADMSSADHGATPHGTTAPTETMPSSGRRPVTSTAERAADPACCFLRVSNIPNFVFDRLSRYEVALWRQVGQTLLVLDALDRRKPHERTARLPHRQHRLPAFGTRVE